MAFQYNRRSQSAAHRRRPLGRVLGLALVGLATSAAMVWAGWPSELAHLPERANAIGLIDLAALRGLAQEGRGETRPIAEFLEQYDSGSSGQIEQLVLAAQLDLDALEPNWEIAVAHTKAAIDPSQVARSEDGYLDDIGGRQAVWSPRNAYFLPALKPNQIVAIRPANRQLVARWLQLVADEDLVGLGSYLTSITRYSTDDIPLFLAIELRGAISPVQARKKLEGMPDLAASPRQLEAASQLASELRGLYFAVRARDGLTGKLQLDFSARPEALESLGKRLVAEILEARGLPVPEIERWQARVDDDSYSLSGELTPKSLARVLDVLRSPRLVGSMTVSPSPPSASETPSQSDTQAAASKRYFDSVRKILDEVRDFSPKSPGNRAEHDERVARKINDLPILNVDPELIDYGMQVAALLRGSSLGSREAAMRAGVARAGQPGSYTNYYRYYGVRGVNTPNYGARQSDTQARATSQQGYLSAMQQIDDLTAQIRRTMTERFQREF